MKASPKAGLLGLLLLAFIPVVSFGLITSRQNNLIGKFYVSSVKGIVTCISNGRILELKKGDAIVARGTVIETPAGGSLTLVFSNGTGAFIEEKTHLEIEKFDQEFFTPNNNLRVEPSNSSTIVRVTNGRLLIGTPRLLSGTTMVYETPHAAINIKGEKVLLEVSTKQTHVAMIAGNASVVPRGPDGTFVSLGRHLKTGEEAFVKRTVTGEPEDQDAEEAEAAEAKAAASKATAGKSAEAVAKKAPAPRQPVTKQTEVTVLKITGVAHAKPNPESAEMPLSEGSAFGVGATITADDAAEVHLQVFPGAIATLRPRTSVEIEKLAVTMEGRKVKKRTAILSLKSGTVYSTIDPAEKDVNAYAVRTPNGLATAHGTSFAVSVEHDDLFVAVSADVVTFTTATGTSYEIAAGRVSITPAGGQPQPPIPLAQAVAGNAAFVSVIQSSVSILAEVVQNNIGHLSAASATNLLTKVANTAASALPSQSAAFETQLATAVTAPHSATADTAGASLSAVTQALAAGAPNQAAAIATAGAGAVPAQANVVAAAVVKQTPAQAAQVASAVTQTLVRVGPDGTVTPASVQAAASLASAVTTSAPGQAAPVAAAVMQALALASPQTPPQTTAVEASAIASSVTSAAPTQAVPVASAMMKVVITTPTFADASDGVIAQAGAALAASVTSVVPPQAQPVATAVMQLITQGRTGVTPDAAQQAAGLIAAAVSQVAPNQADAVATGLANATNQSVAAVQTSAVLSAGDAAQVSSLVSQSSQITSVVVQQSGAVASAVNTGYAIAVNATGIDGGGAAGSSSLADGGLASSGGSSGSGQSGATGSSGSSGGGSSSGSSGSSGTGGASGSGSSGSGESSITVVNTGNGANGAGTGSGSSGNGSGGSSGGGDNSIVVVNGYGGSSAGGGSGAGGNSGGGNSGAGSGTGDTGGASGGSASGNAGDNSTSIIVTQFDPNEFNGVMNGLGAVQAAQSGVQFSSDTTGTTVTPLPTIPPSLPVDFVVSAANQ